MNVLISGGSKNGKTRYALDIAAMLSGNGKKYYVATMIPCDNEDSVRIENHIKEREGMGFETLEIGCNIANCLENNGAQSTFLIDSITALLSNEMFSSFENECYDLNAEKRCIDGLTEIADNSKNTIFVTDYIFSDAEIYDETTEQYRRFLANINNTLAEKCDVVIELCAGNIIFYKGGEKL
jgi:adenosylcobinamide kinase/adenosylcobinamide-phosphate guanylyltransferase